MLQRLAVFILCFSFTLNASTPSTEGLKIAFDELQYALTVEWDQKDQQFKDEQIKKFQDEMLILMQQGLTKIELLAFFKSQLRDEKQQKDFEELYLQNFDQKVSESDIEKLVLKTLEGSHAQGASWEDKSAIVALITMPLFIAVMAYFIYYTNTDEYLGSGGGGGGSSSGSYYSNGTYYTSDGEEINPDTGTTYSDAYDPDRCYAEKYICTQTGTNWNNEPQYECKYEQFCWY